QRPTDGGAQRGGRGGCPEKWWRARRLTPSHTTSPPRRSPGLMSAGRKRSPASLTPSLKKVTGFSIFPPASARGIRLAHTPYSSTAESTADGRGQQYWR